MTEKEPEPICSRSFLKGFVLSSMTTPPDASPQKMTMHNSTQ
eukprot:CAMPEP_0183335308 /NCGR_PEP_ID=MMETSP0164_2-20130417/3654_1 /TAXON_ID=221442 /ORGANISM="Coccolithus pelagicus ssp braarudi, Strain PLY182g" /LENGTH=41 /DNA_ID= /DNA_START= /DNA_END= /DNA_ORIENTATION=